ncbi:MAG: hypothetical protein CGW95_15830, partial [Phenylobacterium zucineum]
AEKSKAKDFLAAFEESSAAAANEWLQILEAHGRPAHIRKLRGAAALSPNQRPAGVANVDGESEGQDSDIKYDNGKNAEPKRGPHRRLSYKLLYSITVSGERKAISNSIQRAAAVLGNSKRLFLGHLDRMFKCLDPRLAELCYVDTDSCIWSLSKRSLEECLRPDRLDQWRSKGGVLADESGAESCHGKLKHEGTFDGGLFKSVKIYRLFNSRGDAEAADDGGDDEMDNSFRRDWTVAYTRCKSVHRSTAEKLSDRVFDPLETVKKFGIHRTVLRPTRAGEMAIKRESRSLPVPFNLKRLVSPDGLHTVCLNYFGKSGTGNGEWGRATSPPPFEIDH